MGYLHVSCNEPGVFVVEGRVAYEESIILAVCEDFTTCRQYMEKWEKENPDHHYDRICFAKVQWVGAA